MAKLPKSPCKWGGRTVSQIREALGIKGTKMPQDMHGEFRVDGWQVVIKRGPKRKSAGKDWRGRERYVNSAKHRIFVRVDGRLIPAGRVQQALCRPLRKGSMKTWQAMSYGPNALSGSRKRRK